MANQTLNTEVSPEEQARSTVMWGRFTQALKWAVISIATLLVLMAWFIL